MLIINADDFGRSPLATDNIITNFRQGGITSSSAMVFMEDSARAAELAKEYGLEVGLHLNFTQRIDNKNQKKAFYLYHANIIQYLTSRNLNFLVYNHYLRRAFDYVFQAQFDEYERIYGVTPTHIDGHHHMHLCSNMIVQALIPRGQVVRRHFTYIHREKNLFNRKYRSIIDIILKRRYLITDFLFSLSEGLRLGSLLNDLKLATDFNVELQTHPEIESEFIWLMTSTINPKLKSLTRGSFSSIIAESLKNKKARS